MTATSSSTDLLQRANELEAAARILADEAKTLRRAVERQARGRQDVAPPPLSPLLSELTSNTNGPVAPASPMPSIEELALQVAVILQEQDMLPRETEVPVTADPAAPFDLDEVKDAVYERVETELLSSGELTRHIHEALESVDLAQFQREVLRTISLPEVYKRLAEALVDPIYKALVEDSNILASAIAAGYLQRYRIEKVDLQEGLATVIREKLTISVTD